MMDIDLEAGTPHRRNSGLRGRPGDELEASTSPLERGGLPDLDLLEEVQGIDPALERRFRLLLAERSRLEAAEARAARGEGVVESEVEGRKRSDRLTALSRQ